jgi:transposase-like protein
MSKELHNPTTLLEAVQYFSDSDVCHAYMVRVKWPDGKITCPHCGGEQVGEIKSRRMFQCKDKECRRQFSTKVGTIFEDSPLSLTKWFVAVWSITNAKNGISSCEVARALGITQKSAWHMLHRIRLAMRTKSFRKIIGEIESDETFVGGKARNMHVGKRKVKGTGPIGKTVVHGLLERGGEVRCSVVPNNRKPTVQSAVRANVAKGAYVYTDALRSYQGLDDEYLHQVVDHAKCYVEGRVHTNGLENFWSLLKRALKGTYVAVAPFHLERYLDEQSFRFNKRKGNDCTRFLEAMLSICGKRLTYDELTGRMSPV